MLKKKTYLLEHLCCANCAAKIEKQIQELPEVDSAVLTFVTKKLTVTGEDLEDIFPKIEAIAKKIEPDIVLKEAKKDLHLHEHASRREHEHNHEHEHGHGETCDCVHTHDHVHQHAEEESHDQGGTGNNEDSHVQGENCNCRHKHDHVHQHAGEESHNQGGTDSNEDAHEHGENCDCGHTHDHVHQHAGEESHEHGEKKEKSGKIPTDLRIGAGLFIIAVAVSKLGAPLLPVRLLFLAAYLLLANPVLRRMLKQVGKGQIFDENFLMSIATIGAFAIGDFPEAVGVMLFYRIGEYFEDLAVERSRSQIMEAVDLRPEVVNLITQEEIRVMPAAEATVGDILLVRPGDRIPLDGTVVEGESRIDTSAVTGEPVPVHVTQGDSLLSGCVNEQGVLKMRVEKVLAESMVSRILESVESAAASKPKIDRFITRFAGIYTPVVVFAAIATAVLPSLLTGNWHYWIYTAITFLVISCPCALVLSVPLAFFSGIGAGSKKGILFKGGVAIEALQGVRSVVMDKTGTLTKGDFAVTKIVSLGRLKEKQILTMAADAEEASTHPIAAGIVKAAKEQSCRLVHPITVEEFSGRGIRATFPEGEVLLGNAELLKMHGVDISSFPGEDYGTVVLVSVAGMLQGYLLLSDVVKEDAKETVAAMHREGLHTAILTGDARKSAEGVAKEVGVKEVFAKLLPDEKLERLSALRREHGAVLFVGDGINDAPVLAGADVGAAMGNGADAAIEAADVVFLNSSVDAIRQAIRISKQTGRIAKQNVVFALLVKALVLVLGFFGFANMWMAVFADTGVAMLCVLNAIRLLYKKQ